MLSNNYYYPTVYHDNIFTSLSQDDVLNYDNVALLEQKICDIVGCKYCITTCNGQMALYAIMSVMNIDDNENNNIIIPDWSYPAFYLNAKHMNIKCKFADIKKDTLSMNPDDIESLIDENTKAICFINHLGYLGEDIVRIQSIAKEHNLWFIEDSAHALGSIYNGKHAGTFGDMSIFSFSGSKLIRSGEGGCICTNNEELYKKAKYLVRDELNLTMSPILAKLLYEQLSNFDWYMQRNKEIRDIYKKCGVPIYENTTDNNFSLHVVYMTKNAYKLFQKLNNMNIPCRYMYYRSLTHLPVASEVEREYLELPCSLSLTENEIKKIANAIRLFDR